MADGEVNVDVIIELKERGIEWATLISNQLYDLNETVKDVNASLERMADRARADAAAMLALAGATAVAKGSAGGGGILGFAQALFFGGGATQFLIVTISTLAVVFAPLVVVLAGAIVLMTAFAAGVATLGATLFIGLGAIGALAAGIVYLGNRTTAGHAAMVQFGADVTAMLNQLSQWSTSLLIPMLDWARQFIPLIEWMGSTLITWFGVRLPAILPIMTHLVDTLSLAFRTMAGAIGQVVDYVISHPQLLKFFDQMVGWGTVIGTGLLANLLRLADWFTQRLPQIEKIVLPIFGGIGNAIQGIATVAGKVVDWFLAHWGDLTKLVGQGWADLVKGFAPFKDIIDKQLPGLNAQLKDVASHLSGLGPLWTVMGGIAGAVLLALTTAAEVLLADLRFIETILGNEHPAKAGAGVIGHGGLGHQGAGGLGNPWVPPVTGIGPNTVAGGAGGVIAGHGRPMSGMTVLPIVFSPIPPSQQQVQFIREQIRRLDRAQT